MPGWIGPAVAISLMIIAAAYLAIVFVILGIVKGIAQQASTVSREIGQLREELTPTLQYLGRLGREGADVAEMAKNEFEEIVQATRTVRKDLERGLQRTRRRLADFEAVIDVVQDEVEETALDLGAALRTARTGPGLVGQVRRFLVPPRARRR